MLEWLKGDSRVPENRRKEIDSGDWTSRSYTKIEGVMRTFLQATKSFEISLKNRLIQSLGLPPTH
jgi:hypothetical protein